VSCDKTDVGLMDYFKSEGFGINKGIIFCTQKDKFVILYY